MRPRATLLLIIGAVLVLPAAGWQLVKQSESLLREGQERAQLMATEALARALAATAPFAPPAGPGLYIHRLHGPLVLDGARDDWLEYPGGQSSDARFSVALAQDASLLYALIEVSDSSRARADAGQPMAAPGDRIELDFLTPAGQRRLELGNAAPGDLQIAGDPELAGSSHGKWVETPAGYRVELALPLPQADARLRLRVHDQADTGAQPAPLSLSGSDEQLALIRPDARFDQALATLVPKGGRLRLLSNEGWVLAQAGQLAVAEASAGAQRPMRLRGLLYWLLLAPPAENAGDYAPELTRLDAAVVWQALSGVGASSVRATERQNSVIVAAAVPYRAQGVVRGALLFEQPSRALLLLADRAVFNLIGASLLAVMLAAAVLLGYAGVQSVRIRRLRDAAEHALTPDGRLEPKLPHLSAEGDLGDLSRSFARLLSEIGAYTDYLRSLGSKLSHELHTPLAIVRSSLDNLDQSTLPEEAQVYAERARNGAERLTSILRQLSEASRVEHAIASADAEHFDLAELVRGMEAPYRELLAPRRLEVSVPSGPVPFHGAPDLIVQALDKLIDNARSFAPPDAWVRIVLARAADGVRLTVSNAGPQLPTRMQGQLFDSLVSVRERAVPGEGAHLGLGLYIVRLVAALHMGQASAANLDDGGGVEFDLKLAGMPRAPM